jgi:hypothetical protein
MAKPILVLQYPNEGLGTTVLAATRNPQILRAFKKTVLEEACEQVSGTVDKVLRLNNTEELRRLDKVLSAVIPD